MSQQFAHFTQCDNNNKRHFLKKNCAWTDTTQTQNSWLHKMCVFLCSETIRIPTSIHLCCFSLELFVVFRSDYYHTRKSLLSINIWHRIDLLFRSHTRYLRFVCYRQQLLILIDLTEKQRKNFSVPSNSMINSVGYKEPSHSQINGMLRMNEMKICNLNKLPLAHMKTRKCSNGIRLEMISDNRIRNDE